MKISAVVVTHNRLELLKECISALEEQSLKLCNIIVVNNGSTDGTNEWLLGKSNLLVIEEKNLGGANGFFVGIKKAYELGSDWVWCLDDDTIAEKETLINLTNSVHFNNPNTGFLCSKVLWNDGSLHRMNAVMPINDLNIYHDIETDYSVQVAGASFVSLLISRNAIKTCGLPIKEFFIWGDDVEFTNRIANYFKCYLKLDSVVIHKTRLNETADFSQMNESNFFKYKYLIRNHIWFLRKRRKKGNVILDLFQHLKNIYTVTRYAKKNKLIFKVIKPLISGYFFNPKIITKI
jgi:GT2 family glycosyltransferase